MEQFDELPMEPSLAQCPHCIIETEVKVHSQGTAISVLFLSADFLRTVWHTAFELEISVASHYVSLSPAITWLSTSSYRVRLRYRRAHRCQLATEGR